MSPVLYSYEIIINYNKTHNRSVGIEDIKGTVKNSLTNHSNSIETEAVMDDADKIEMKRNEQNEMIGY